LWDCTTDKISAVTSVQNNPEKKHNLFFKKADQEELDGNEEASCGHKTES